MSKKERDGLDAKQFAFRKHRKVPIHDAEHVRRAMASFDQVKGASDKQRSKAWRRITKAAKKFDVEISKRWRELKPDRTGDKARRKDKKKAKKKAKK